MNITIQYLDWQKYNIHPFKFERADESDENTLPSTQPQKWAAQKRSTDVEHLQKEFAFKSFVHQQH